MTGQGRRTSDESLRLLSSSLLQTATHPHGHHLGIPIVILHYEGMILANKKTHAKLMVPVDEGEKCVFSRNKEELKIPIML